MTRVFVSSVLALSVVSAGAQGGNQQGVVFRGAGDTVQVFVTVTDKANRLVPNLTRDDFQVFDGGKLQPLTVFDNSPQAVRLIVLIDVSTSMYGNLPLLRGACHELFLRLGTQDLARVGTFGKEIDLGPEFTRDTDVLDGALPKAIDLDAPTPLWRAMDTAMTALDKAEGRKVILVLSDSKDSMTGKFGQKFIGQLDVQDRALREDVMIYGVGLRSRNAPGMSGGGSLSQQLTDNLPDPGLGTVALETGGGYFELTPRDDLAATFGKVADELHSQYLLGYSVPARDGKTHKVDVKTTVKDVKTRAKKSYVAPKTNK